MLTEERNNFSGLLLEWSGGTIQPANLLACPRIRHGRLMPNSHWEEYAYNSPVPLRGEEPATGGHFLYPLLVRRSGPRILLMSSSRQVVEHLLDTELPHVFSPRLRSVSIAVDTLVKALTERPTLYVLSFVHARVPAFGMSLRSVSYYGDDLAEATLFRNHVNLMNFFTCGLRQAVGGNEIVRLGSDGQVSFYLVTEQKVLEVEEVLRFLRQQGYLPDVFLPHLK